MKRFGVFAAVLLGVWALAGCTKNPVDPSPAGPMNTLVSGTTGYFGVAEALTSAVLFSPTNVSQITTYSGFHPNCVAADAGKFGGGTIQYSWGGTSYVYTSATYPGHTSQGGFLGQQSTALLMRGSGVGGYYGIGGQNGDFLNDEYVSFIGFKGPNASADYNSMVVNFVPGTGSFVDLSCYRGFMFYARGNGKFGVQFAATGIKTGQAGPYTDYNYYEYVFGDQMSPTSWKQFVVNFTDLQQLYGTAVDLNAVIQKATGLQFIQETPYTQDFQLDLDYIRFF